jgi:tetratricopeptide (TPR) repeat protein
MDLFLKPLAFLALFSLQFTNVNAQMNLDSLQNVLKKEKTDSITFMRYMELLNTNATEDIDASLMIGNWISENALKTKSYKFYTVSLIAIAHVYHYTSDFVPAIKYYVEAQKAAEKYGLYEEELESLNDLANVYFLNNQYEKAEELYLKTIEGCKKHGITQGVAVGYGSLGTIYYNTSDTDIARKQKGIEYMKLSVAASESMNDTTQLIRVYSNVALMYKKLNRLDSALYWVERSGELMKARKNNQEGYLYHYFHKGQILAAMKDYKGAIASFLTGVDYTKKFHSPMWESSHYDGLASAYKALGDYQKALQYYEKYFHLEDSLITKENFAKAADIQNKYQREKKEKEIIRLNKNNEINALLLDKETQTKKDLIKTIISIVIVLFLLITLALFLVRTIRERKKAYTRLQEQNIEIKTQGAQLNTQSKLIARYQSQMNPHFIFNALNNIQGFVISSEKEKAVHQLQSFSSLMRQTLNNSETETIPLDKELGFLQTYLAFEQERFANKISVEIKCVDAPDEILVPPMMIQPFLENAFKHAGLQNVVGAKIRLLIKTENEFLQIEISDNGTGIDLNKTDLIKNSHAIFIIKSRIQLLFQSHNIPLKPDYFEIASAPGKGTTVRFYLPLIYNY